MKKIRITILSLLYFFFHFGSAQTTYHVYYLGGQSNMDGFGYVNELPADMNQPMTGVMIFHGNTSTDTTNLDGKGIWSTLKPGNGTGFSSDGTSNSYSDRFGVELTLAKRLKKLKPNQNIALIKYSRGGTSIDAAAASYFGCWEPDFDVGNGINQYDHFMATVRNAFIDKDIDGDGKQDILIPSGIVWMQGESDGASSQEVALRYEKNLKRLMDLIRAAFRNPDLRVVVGRISDSHNDESGLVWKYGNLIRQAQEAYCFKDQNAALVTSTDEYGYSDPWHYDSKGYLELGEKFAEALMKIIQ